MNEPPASPKNPALSETFAGWEDSGDQAPEVAPFSRLVGDAPDLDELSHWVEEQGDRAPARWVDTQEVEDFAARCRARDARIGRIDAENGQIAREVGLSVALAFGRRRTVLRRLTPPQLPALLRVIRHQPGVVLVVDSTDLDPARRRDALGLVAPGNAEAILPALRAADAVLLLLLTTDGGAPAPRAAGPVIPWSIHTLEASLRGATLPDALVQAVRAAWRQRRGLARSALLEAVQADDHEHLQTLLGERRGGNPLPWHEPRSAAALFLAASLPELGWAAFEQLLDQLAPLPEAERATAPSATATLAACGLTVRARPGQRTRVVSFREPPTAEQARQELQEDRWPIASSLRARLLASGALRNPTLRGPVVADLVTVLDTDTPWEVDTALSSVAAQDDEALVLLISSLTEEDHLRSAQRWLVRHVRALLARTSVLLDLAGRTSLDVVAALMETLAEPAASHEVAPAVDVLASLAGVHAATAPMHRWAAWLPPNARYGDLPGPLSRASVVVDAVLEVLRRSIGQASEAHALSWQLERARRDNSLGPLLGVLLHPCVSTRAQQRYVVYAMAMVQGWLVPAAPLAGPKLDAVRVEVAQGLHAGALRLRALVGPTSGHQTGRDLLIALALADLVGRQTPEGEDLFELVAAALPALRGRRDLWRLGGWLGVFEAQLRVSMRVLRDGRFEPRYYTEVDALSAAIAQWKDQLLTAQRRLEAIADATPETGGAP